MMNPNLINQIKHYVNAQYPILFFHTHEEITADYIIQQVANQRSILEWEHANGWIDFVSKRPLNPKNQLANPAKDLAEIDDLSTLSNKIIVLKDIHHFLKNASVISRLRSISQKIMRHADLNSTLIIISDSYFIPSELEHYTQIINIPLPHLDEILSITQKIIQHYRLKVNDDVIQKICTNAKGLTRHELQQLLSLAIQTYGTLNDQALSFIFKEKGQIIRKNGILEMIPLNENLNDIGGLDQLKQWLKIKSAIMNHLHLASQFCVETPKGVLIVGMPGCGKSLTAKATAHLFQMPLLRLDMGAILGKFVGDSESNMRSALKLAESISPCILWIDELEKAFSGIGDQNSSEVSTRLFGYFLTWLQEKSSSVFVIATANMVDGLPPELLRKGRFDEIFQVDFPNYAERRSIFEIHLKKRQQLNSNIDLQKLAEQTDGFCGADIEFVIRETLEMAFVSQISTLNTSMILKIIQKTTPLSIVMKDKIKNYKEIYKTMNIRASS